MRDVHTVLDDSSHGSCSNGGGGVTVISPGSASSSYNFSAHRNSDVGSNNGGDDTRHPEEEKNGSFDGGGSGRRGVSTVNDDFSDSGGGNDKDANGSNNSSVSLPPPGRATQVINHPIGGMELSLSLDPPPPKKVELKTPTSTTLSITPEPPQSIPDRPPPEPSSPPPKAPEERLSSSFTSQSKHASASASRRRVEITVPPSLAKVPLSALKFDRNDIRGRGAFASVIVAEVIDERFLTAEPPKSTAAPLANLSATRKRLGSLFGRKNPSPEVDNDTSIPRLPNRVAIKIIDKARALSCGFVNIQNEIDICAHLKHPCIINAHGVVIDADHIYIIMDLAEKGELFKYMEKYGHEDMPQVAPNFMAQAVLSLEYLGDYGVIHRDVKPENLLLTSDFHVKLADFGTVCKLDSAENSQFTGTPLYVSPEMLKHGRGSSTSDIWALGCTLFQLFVGRPPFMGATEYLLLQAIKERRFEFPPYFPPDARDLVNKMLQSDPEKRITFPEIKKHPFFKNVDWDTVHTQKNQTFLNQDFDTMYKKVLLPGEHIVYASSIIKDRHKVGGIYIGRKIRTLCLTDYPRLFYFEVKGQDTFEVKGQVPWSRGMYASSENEKDFIVFAEDKKEGPRTYMFKDADNHAHIWVAKINHMIKTKPPGF